MLEGRVSLYSVIGRAVKMLQLSNVNSLVDDFALWAMEAEVKIGSEETFRHVECEIEVKNWRACLPRDFAYLNAIKHGQNYIDVTKRDFRLFNKAPRIGVTNSRFQANQLVVADPGQVLSIRVTIAGTFIAGDIISVTVSATHNNSIASNIFTYIVQGGDTLTTICSAIAGQINAIGNLGYTANAGAGTIDITGSTVNITFTVATTTDSSGGTISSAIYQAHRPAKNVTINTTTGCEVAPETSSNNLANRNAFEHNTGINAFNGYLAVEGDIGLAAPKYTIDNGYIYFNTIENDRVGISYQGVWLDEEGWPLIKKSHEDAVAHYIAYMHSIGEFRHGRVTQAYFTWLERRWFWLCGQARGDDNMPNDDEMQWIASQWLSLISPVNKNYF